MNYLVALAAGAILPLSLEPFGWWPLGLVSVGVLFYLLRSCPAKAGWLGWLFGVGKYGVGVSWVYVSIHVYGNASPALAGGLVVLFVAGLGLFSMAMAVAYRWLRNDAPMLDAMVFVCVFVGFEWLLTWVLTGFPWLYPGYAHLATPLAGFAPLGGVLLVSLALTTSACFAVLAVGARRIGDRRWGRPAGTTGSESAELLGRAGVASRGLDTSRYATPR